MIEFIIFKAPIFIAIGDADGVRYEHATDWLIPMITDFLDSDLNAPPPTF